MDGFSVERSQEGEQQGKRLLSISGALTIEQAAGFRERLIEALAASEELHLDLSGVTGIDLSGLQLLCACHQSAEQAGKRFQVLHEGSEIFHKVTADAGFQRHVGCDRDLTKSCIWVEERNDG